MLSEGPTIAPNFRTLTARLTLDQRLRLLATLSREEAEAVAADWASWAHPGQLPPAGDWRTWVVLGGRGFGKTRAGAEWIAGLVRAAGQARAALRIALVAATIDEARRVMVEGDSGLLTVAGDIVVRWHPSRRLLRFTGGSEAVLFSGASPEALRGPQHSHAWCDELAKWDKAQATWDMLQMGLRLGDPADGGGPRALVTTTPRAGAVLRRIMAQPGCVVTGGPTRANPHLAAGFREGIEALYAGTRLGRQELDGELLPDAAGALWSVDLIERCRLANPPRDGEGDHAQHGGGGAPPDEAFAARPLHHSAGAERSPSPGRGGFERTLIAVDPPSGDGTCGIIACACDADGIAHVLADHSVTARSPEGWARAVAGAAAAHGTVEVVAEANQGGRMVKAVLLAADGGLNVRLVTARVGKSLRAEPVAHLFEAGRVRLHGRMPELEAQLLGMIAGGGYEGPGTSPDRADAMVWGVGEVVRVRGVRVRGV